MPSAASLRSFISRCSYIQPICSHAGRDYIRLSSSLTRSISSANRRPEKSKLVFKCAALAVGAVVVGGATIVATSTSTGWPRVVHAEAPPQPPAKFIRLDEVRRHGRDSDRKWVIKGTRVFDITDWIAAHPGGPVILRAVGGSIDPYWAIFTIHQKPEVYDVLEEYCIGDIDPRDLVDGRVRSDDIDDPFVNDPVRDPRLMQHTQKPCNAESPASALSTFITPTETFYVRNHLWVPQAKEETHTLTVELPDGDEKEYSLSELKTKFKPFRMTATLQCSGNRRKHMSAGAGPATGLQWDVGAISNAEWTGVRLRDVLHDAGVDSSNGTEDEDVKHVHFVGAEAYAASIPICKALDPRGDVMLAYAMNGKPLSPDHGYPLRALVPGHTAARSVKWLEKIVLSEEESHSQWQRRDYKCFGPNQAAKDVDWSTAPAIQETPVQSAITSISAVQEKHTDDSKSSLKQDSPIKVEGYAFSGGGREIIRVDVSGDGGRTWQQAQIFPDESKGQKRWSWKRWQILVDRPAAGSEFAVKAVDDSYNTQPDSYAGQFNFRGNLTTAWHRVECPKPNSAAE